LEEIVKKHLFLCTVLSLASAYSYSETTNSTEKTKTHIKHHRHSEVRLFHPRHTFEIQLSALLLQPTGSNLHYAAEAVPLPLPSPHWKIHEIATDYHFGFDVALRGMFHHTNTNLALNWEHFHSTDSAKKTVSSNNMIGPFFEIGPDASPYKKAHGKVSFHFDEVDLTYGIFVNFGNRLRTNFFSGVSFARIEEKRSSKFSNFEGTIVRSIKVPSTFTGAGPQIGLDFCYRIVKGLRFSGDAAVSLLVGTQKNHTKYKALSPALPGVGIVPPNRQKTSVHDTTQVVPGIEGMLGLAYDFTFREHYLIKLEVGYQAQVYIDALQSVDMGSEVITPPVLPDTVGVFARTFEPSLSNFALAGPYFKLIFGF
jgi:hypothetical protein